MGYHRIKPAWHSAATGYEHRVLHLQWATDQSLQSASLSLHAGTLGFVVMDDEHHMPTTGVGRSFRPQKLKDTCDMCSASKVRCDKKKPICSRCERLGYPCFFSPARRIRKRRSNRSISTGKKPEAAEQSLERQPTDAVGDENVAPGFNALDDTVDFNFGDGIDGADPLEGDKSYSSTLSGDNPSMPLQNSSHHDTSNSSTMEPISMGSGYGQSSPSVAAEFDCATVAMNILEHLNTTSIKRPFTATPFGGSKPPTLDALINTSSMAIKRVSTMLICPCSKRPDVGLLAAAVCAALLDTYELILRNSTRSKVVPAEKHRGVKRSSGNSVMRDAEGTDLCTNDLQDGPNEKATIMRILEELPKVANLVTQFTKRYSQDAEKRTGDVPQALAASLTARLKSMIDEVTNWVAQI